MRRRSVGLPDREFTHPLGAVSLLQRAGTHAEGGDPRGDGQAGTGEDDQAAQGVLERVDRGFPDAGRVMPCASRAWRGVRHEAIRGVHDVRGNGAGEEARTLDINLGRVALYQLSYARKMALLDGIKSSPIPYQRIVLSINHGSEGWSGTPTRTARGLVGTKWKWSGRWDSNPRPSAWEAEALPLSYIRERRATGTCRTPRRGTHVASRGGRTGKARSEWWSLSDSNRPPPACKADALPDELRPQRWNAPSRVAEARIRTMPGYRPTRFEPRRTARRRVPRLDGEIRDM